jgi:hypothetical protein
MTCPVTGLVGLITAAVMLMLSRKNPVGVHTALRLRVSERQRMVNTNTRLIILLGIWGIPADLAFCLIGRQKGKLGQEGTLLSIDRKTRERM